MDPTLWRFLQLLACTLLTAVSVIVAMGCSWIVYQLWKDSWGK